MNTTVDTTITEIQKKFESGELINVQDVIALLQGHLRINFASGADCYTFHFDMASLSNDVKFSDMAEVLRWLCRTKFTVEEHGFALAGVVLLPWVKQSFVLEGVYKDAVEIEVIYDKKD